MKPEAEHPNCAYCGEPVLNKEEATITPLGVYHSTCDIPDLSSL